ncbi:hypothetical protein VCHA53O466_50349 [Vibrio chagasii]|nr:hypothetical protein VCHA53O466_50349 [Vibrio chagasii]
MPSKISLIGKYNEEQIKRKQWWYDHIWSRSKALKVMGVTPVALIYLIMISPIPEHNSGITFKLFILALYTSIFFDISCWVWKKLTSTVEKKRRECRYVGWFITAEEIQVRVDKAPEIKEFHMKVIGQNRDYTLAELDIIDEHLLNKDQNQKSKN